MSRADVVRERLFANLDQLVEDVEALVDATSDRSDGAIASVRQRISHTATSAKNTILQAKKIINASRKSAEAVMTYTRNHCWARLAIQAGAAVALLCVARSRIRRNHLRPQQP